MTELEVEENIGEAQFLIGVIRKQEGKAPKLVLRWDSAKVIERLCSKTSEKYFKSGKFRRPKTLEKFIQHLRSAWEDLSGELESEKENTPNI